MSCRIVLLSGPLAVGKTAIADSLSERFGYRKISSSSYLRQIAIERGLPDSRESLQNLGDALDEETEFNWLVDEVAKPQVANEETQREWFVDAVRKPQQVQHFRTKFEDVLHVHLTASEDILKTRFFHRSREGDGATTSESYERILAHPNEQTSRSLGEIANLTLNLSDLSPSVAADTIANYNPERT